VTMGFERFWRFTPRFGPEWGSGGVFGLRYHKGTLYFNLAFEAEAHFVKGDGEKVYRYDLVGPGPASGGDTYNAVAAVDDDIYFGGWVHTPAVISKEEGILHFYNKFSHVHKYDIQDDEVSLLWKEGAGEKLEWAGEVSEILHNGVQNELLLARADGDRNLGIYRLSLQDNHVERICEDPGLHGTVFMDHAAFNTGGLFMDGVQLINLHDHRKKKLGFDLSGKMSRDGGSTSLTSVGSLSSAFGRLFAFVRSGIFVGDPLSDSNEDAFSFVRLFDFPGCQVSPFRANSLPVGGGILTAYSSLPDMLGLSRAPIVMPSVLVYVTPPSVKVVATLGSRVTSLESCSSRLLVAGNTMPNISSYKTTALDTGHRDILQLSPDILSKHPSPLDISLTATDLGTSHWGGIPLDGYRKAKMVIRASKANTLQIFEYDLSLPSQPEVQQEAVKLSQGRNNVDLSGFNGIVSFRFTEADPQARIGIHLS